MLLFYYIILRKNQNLIYSFFLGVLLSSSSYGMQDPNKEGSSDGSQSEIEPLPASLEDLIDLNIRRDEEVKRNISQENPPSNNVILGVDPDNIFDLGRLVHSDDSGNGNDEKVVNPPSTSNVYKKEFGEDNPEFGDFQEQVELPSSTQPYGYQKKSNNKKGSVEKLGESERITGKNKERVDSEKILSEKLIHYTTEKNIYII